MLETPGIYGSPMTAGHGRFTSDPSISHRVRFVTHLALVAPDLAEFVAARRPLVVALRDPDDSKSVGVHAGRGVELLDADLALVHTRITHGGGAVFLLPVEDRAGHPLLPQVALFRQLHPSAEALVLVELPRDRRHLGALGALGDASITRLRDGRTVYAFGRTSDVRGAQARLDRLLAALPDPLARDLLTAVTQPFSPRLTTREIAASVGVPYHRLCAAVAARHWPPLLRIARIGQLLRIAASDESPAAVRARYAGLRDARMLRRLLAQLGLSAAQGAGQAREPRRAAVLRGLLVEFGRPDPVRPMRVGPYGGGAVRKTDARHAGSKRGGRHGSG